MREATVTSSIILLSLASIRKKSFCVSESPLHHASWTWGTFRAAESESGSRSRNLHMNNGNTRSLGEGEGEVAGSAMCASLSVLSTLGALQREGSVIV